MSYITFSRKFFVVLCAFTTLMASAHNTCLIGNNDERQQDRTSSGYLYLDIDHPTSCAGVITNWTLCYYRPMPTDNKRRSMRMAAEYWATFAVYRKTNYGYTRVSSILSSRRSMHSISQDHILVLTK